MEICNRCKINKAEIKCDKCNKKYCKLCDYYLHVINKDIHNNKNNKSKDIDNISTLKTGKIKDIKKSNNNIIPNENKNVNLVFITQTPHFQRKIKLLIQIIIK